MKIARIRATPVNIPLEAPYLWAYGALGGFSRTIVEVETSDGIVGLGDVGSPAAAGVIDAMAPRLIGLDALDPAACERRVLPSWSGIASTIDFSSIRAFGAIDMALWDIRGKAWGRPIYDLLGGAVRHRVAFTDYYGFRLRHGDRGGEATVEAVVDYCLDLHQRFGTTAFEGKLSDPDPTAGIEILRRLRAALGPRAILRVDSNMAYSLTTALEIARPLVELGVRNWEDPCARFEDVAALARHSPIRTSAHSPDLRRAAELGAPHALCTDVATHGGFARTQRFIGACEAMGVDFWCYSGDSGIGTAAYLHLAAANQWIREPSQSLLRMQPLDVIEEGPFVPKDNSVTVPTGPGLGVTLSAEKLAFCHRHFVDHGPYNKYHDPENPGIMRRLPLA